MKKRLYNFWFYPPLLVFLFSCNKESIEPVIAWHDVQTVSSNATSINNAADNLAMGNPSGAITNTNNDQNYLMLKKQFTISYHRDRGIPNWASWHLDSSWLGSAPRQNDFSADVTLPVGWYRVGSNSYSGSGFDRGHNCPSADRTGNITDNAETFLMTNMIPQAPVNNQQIWAKLEDYCRILVRQGNECYIIMGSYGMGGTGSAGIANTIDAGRVTVPNRIWKVILILSSGNDDIKRVTSSARVIAIDTPNSNNINSSWDSYRTTVNAIETITGYNLLSNLSTIVQSSLESKVDAGPTQ